MNDSSSLNFSAHQPAGGNSLADRWASEPAATGGLQFDVRAIWAALYRNRKLTASIIAGAMIVGIAIIYLSTPIFRASAKIQIEQQSTKVLQGDDVAPSDASQDADRFLQTQMDIIQSRSLADRVARDLGLYNSADFSTRMGDRPVVAQNGSAGQSARQDQVLDTLQAHLKVTLPVDSRVVTLSYTSPDAALAAKVANSYADRFIVSNLDRRYNASSYARKFLSEQLDTTRRKVEQSERNQIAYARAARLIDTGGSGDAGSQGLSGGRSLVTASLVQLNTAYSGALGTKIAAQQAWEQAAKAPLLSIPEVQADPAYQGLSQQRARAVAQYEQDAKHWTPDYPEMVQQAAQIKGLDRQINAVANRVKGAIQQRYLVAASQANALSDNLNQFKTQTLSEQERAVQYNILHRELDTNRALYDALLQRYKEVTAAAGLASSNVSIVDRAEAPRSVIWPRPLLILAGCLLAGLMIALGVIFAREHLDDAIRSPEDMAAKLGVPSVGSTPLLPSGTAPIDELEKPRSALSEAYYAMRTSLELASPSGLPKTLLFTSSAASEGKSTTSFAIARDFAKVGRKVLLIDADLRKPTQNRLTGVSNDVGLANLLTQHSTLAEVIQASTFTGLDVIPTGPLPPNPAELLASAGLRILLEKLSRDYDLVVIDAPPVMGLADAPTLAALVEATILVVEANRAHRGQAKTSVRRLRDARANILGGVLTKYDVRMTGYGTGGDSSYDYGYGYGTKGSG
ncbi:MAG: polysaccharide biosynthesis tyrosine autokinase [Oxalobacteraceae bacterium]|nr:MAG: polysaccharide biosynthesis tyrosine autokinase [Oxalobacteraceae bacterium]